MLAQLQLLPGTNYFIGAQSNAAIVIYPSPTASGNGLLGQYYTNSSTTYTNSKNFNPTNLFLTRLDPAVDFNWGPTNFAQLEQRHLHRALDRPGAAAVFGNLRLRRRQR